MEKVYVLYHDGDDIRYSNSIRYRYGIRPNSNVKYNEVLFTQTIPPAREICPAHYIDRYRIATNHSFAQAGHETHNMR